MKILWAGALFAWPLLAADWDARRAAEYLDGRQKEWFAWKPAAAPGGPCLSCHTGVTYLMARPALRKALGEARPTEYETGLVDALRARMAKVAAKDVFPTFATEPQASQAMGVEAIHAALFTGLPAFDRMWSLQTRTGKDTGSWAWFDLKLDPWEMVESRFYGTTLAAMAVGATPREYRKRAGVKERVQSMASYLGREQGSQPLHNRLMLVWASAALPEVLVKQQRKAIIAQSFAKQQADGGWTMESLGPWQAHAGAPAAAGSNGYATAFAAAALVKGGVKRKDPRLARALDWLRARQDRATGAWAAESMNKVYKPESMMAGFMRDAATAFAAIALVE